MMIIIVKIKIIMTTAQVPGTNQEWIFAVLPPPSLCRAQSPAQAHGHLF